MIPGFDQGTFPQGSRLNPFGTATGLNPMISLGNSLRSPTGDGRITFATNAPSTPYLRSVTVDSFNGDNWAPDDRDDTRRLGTGRMDSGFESAATEVRVVTAVNTGQFTSPYLPVPYAPEAVNGLNGRWSWDPATLSIKGVDTNSRDQQYVVLSASPQLTPDLLAEATGPVQGVPEQFIRPPANVPEIVQSTAEAVTAGSSTPYARALAIQRYLRSVEFSYSLQSPVQGGYDGNGLSVLADFLNQKSGYCIHFASAMAVMARLEGIPSRIAVGYAPGRATGATVSIGGQGALPEYEVDARDAHAWPELYFQGLGWVPFEPTPSRGVVPSYATDAQSAGGASTNENNDGLLPSVSPNPAPLPTAAPLPLPGAHATADAASRWLPVLYSRRRRAAPRSAAGVPAAGAHRAAPPPAERRRGRQRGGACRPGPNCATSPWTTAWRRGPARLPVISPTGCASRAPSGNRKALTRPATRPSGSSRRTSNNGNTAARPPGATAPASRAVPASCGRCRCCGKRGVTGRSPDRSGPFHAARPCRAAGAVPRGMAAALPHGRLAACRRGPVPRRAAAQHSAPGAASRVAGQ